MKPISSIEQAIEWTALLRSGAVQPSEQQAFDEWLASSPEHAKAWGRVQAHLGAQLGALASNRSDTARRVLQTPNLQRRQLLRGALAVGGMGIGATWLGHSSGLLDGLGADLRTASGERRSFVLADGSTLLLDACSAVDVHFSASQRSLALRAGKLIIEVSKGARPLAVRTPAGVVRGDSTRFMVALVGDATHVWVMQSSAALSDYQGNSRTLQREQGARLSAAGIDALPANYRGEAGWEDGWLSADDWSLGEVISALRPYRNGVLRVSAEAARLRVSGLFSLDNSDRALLSLEQTMPVRITHYFGLWTAVDVR